MILTLTGENTFAMAVAERQLVDTFIAKYGPHGVEKIDAENITPDKLPDLLQGATLFSPARLVIIKSIGANKAIQEPLALALPRAAQETTVVIADSALDKRTKLYKYLKKDSTFKEFAALTDNQLVQWLRAEASRLGSVLDVGVANLLVERVGRDQWRLLSELQKLAGQPKILPEAIESLVEPNPEVSAFELLDAAVAGKIKKIGQLLAVLKTQEDPYKLFGLITSQVHVLAVVAVANSHTPDAIAKQAGLHPFVVRKAKDAASRLGAERIKALVADVALADSQLKSTSADPWDILRLCLLKIAG